jgi:hypothetical protein
MYVPSLGALEPVTKMVPHMEHRAVVPTWYPSDAIPKGTTSNVCTFDTFGCGALGAGSLLAHPARDKLTTINTYSAALVQDPL